MTGDSSGLAGNFAKQAIRNTGGIRTDFGWLTAVAAPYF